MPLTSGSTVRDIKNKESRNSAWRKVKSLKKKEKKERRVKKSKQREELGEEAVPKEIPATQEDKRIPDDTVVLQNDDEVYAEEQQDEFEPYFSHKTLPKILITTRPRCSKGAYLFASELMGMIPNSFTYKRKTFNLVEITKMAVEKGFTHMIVIGEHQKKVNSIILSHLVNGPTALFKVSSFLSHDSIRGSGEVTAHKPEIILNNFTTRLGRRFGRFFGSMFPSYPQFEGRQVVTFHNQRDYIFVRFHRYIFDDSKTARLQELGPRFTIKPRWLQVGTFNNINGEYEWKFNHKAMEDDRKKWFL